MCVLSVCDPAPHRYHVFSQAALTFKHWITGEDAPRKRNESNRTGALDAHKTHTQPVLMHKALGRNTAWAHLSGSCFHSVWSPVGFLSSWMPSATPGGSLCEHWESERMEAACVQWTATCSQELKGMIFEWWLKELWGYLKKLEVSEVRHVIYRYSHLKCTILVEFLTCCSI